jgi:branched-subunit amino acid aminotransferase/4-amino-4-deoxychorismate lyase
MSTLWFVDGVPSTTVPQLGADTPWTRWGDGIYDTFRIEHGVAVDLDLHLDRVVRACTTSAMPAPSREWLRAHLLDVCVQAARWPSARVRTAIGLVTMESTRCIVSADPYTPPTSNAYARGISLHISDVRHPGLGHLGKSLSYQYFRIAARQAALAGKDDALLFRDGLVGETTTAAIVWLQGGIWYHVADETGVLPSTTRQGLERRGWSFTPTATATLTELLAADAVVTLSGLQIATGVSALGQRTWTQPDEWAVRMRAALFGG